MAQVSDKRERILNFEADLESRREKISKRTYVVEAVTSDMVTMRDDLGKLSVSRIGLADKMFGIGDKLSWAKGSMLPDIERLGSKESLQPCFD